MLRFQKGDRGAFEELVVRNTPRTHALIYRFLGDPSQVEDLTQEVFLRVFRSKARYRPAAKFSTWLYRIVANLCFNVTRTRKKSQMRSLDGGGDDESGYYELADPDPAMPHEGLHDAELKATIATAIGDLPENQRMAILLNKYEDMSYESIATVMDCSTMAVKSLLSRARARLRRTLEPYIQS